MRLASVRTTGTTTKAARVEGEQLVLLPYDDIGEALGSGPDWRGRLEQIDGPRIDRASADLAPVIARPEKIICVGLNYAGHAEEAKLAIPDYPPLFAKFWRSLIGPRDDILLPHNSQHVDWEAELGVIVGQAVRHVSESEALAAIAGFTIVNDVSMRDWQLRTSEFLQGKTFEATSPLGPELVTLDELDDPFDLRFYCEIDGVRRQQARTSEMVVSPAALVSYVSQIITLVPGDVIATGTPGGVGGAMEPPCFLADGQTVRTAIDGLGELLNRCVAEPIEERLLAAVEGG